MKLRQLRFVRIRDKVIYLLIGFALIIGIGFVLRPLQWQFWPVVLSQLLVFAYFVIAVRCFRGADEVVEPPRPWWRMTGGVLSSNLLGAVWAFGALLEFTTFFTSPQTAALLLADLLGGLMYLVFAALFFHSAWRLSRMQAGSAR